MKITEILDQLQNDDAFVLAETRKIQYLYGLKKEIRYAQERHAEHDTESVAEHVYGMAILASYFLPLEDEHHTLDWQKVYEMITYHDIDEVETGDTIGYLKTDAVRAEEAAAAKRVIERAPEVISQHIASILDEYGALASPEAKFVKAIDRIEPLFHLYNAEGKKILHTNGATREQADGLKEAYVKPYPSMKRFFEVLSEQMAQEGFYSS